MMRVIWDTFVKVLAAILRNGVEGLSFFVFRLLLPYFLLFRNPKRQNPKP